MQQRILTITPQGRVLTTREETDEERAAREAAARRETPRTPEQRLCELEEIQRLMLEGL